MKLLKVCLMIIICVINVAVMAQRPRQSVWIGATMPVQLGSKWYWHNDAGYRTLGIQTNAQQFLYRTGGRLQVSGAVSVASGIAFFFTRTSFSKENPEFGREFRTWQELLYEKKKGANLLLSGRLRAEQRYFESTAVTDAYTAHRLRLRGGFTVNVTDKWSVQVMDENMQQFSHSAFAFDQNRLLLNGCFQVNTATVIRAGYMWLLWPSSSQHVATVTYHHQINWHGAGKNEK
jgi:hypothetical protein